MIKEDETSIEEIPEGAEINIIEERYIPNACYYDSLKKNMGTMILEILLLKNQMVIKKYCNSLEKQHYLILRYLFIINIAYMKI